MCNIFSCISLFITSFKFLINNLKMFWILITFLITKISDGEIFFFPEGEIEGNHQGGKNNNGKSCISKVGVVNPILLVN